jgi:hypothetical protein
VDYANQAVSAPSSSASNAAEIETPHGN